MTTSCTYDVEVHGRVSLCHSNADYTSTRLHDGLQNIKNRAPESHEDTWKTDAWPKSSEELPRTTTWPSQCLQEEEGLVSNIDANSGGVGVDVHVDGAAAYGTTNYLSLLDANNLIKV